MSRLMTHMLLIGIREEHEKEWVSVVHSVVHSAEDKTIKRTVDFSVSAVLQERK